MTCASCGRELRPSALFCPACGARVGPSEARWGAPTPPTAAAPPETATTQALPIRAETDGGGREVPALAVCASCGQELRQDARFCPACGAEVGAAETGTVPTTPSQMMVAPAGEPLGRTSGSALDGNPTQPPDGTRGVGRWAWLATAAAVLLAAIAATLYFAPRYLAPSASTTTHPFTETTAPSAADEQPLASTVPSTAPASAPAAPAVSSPAAAPPSPSPPSSPADIVAAYYAAVSARDYNRAWDLGGKNLGASFPDFSAGYASTARDIITIGHAPAVDGQVPVRLLAFTTQGQAQLFTGTYTVDGGVITAGQIAESFQEPAAQFAATPLPQQLADLGYTPQNPAPPPQADHEIDAVPAVCSDSGDGYCQILFFFHRGQLIGVDHAQGDTSVSVAWQNGQTVAATYPQYKENDPMCCASGNPLTVQFGWNGSDATPLSPMPTPVNGR